MFRTLTPLLIFFSVAACAQTSASDHLVPDESLYSAERFENYYRAVNNVLTQLEPEGSIARVIVRPSFFPEYVVGISVDPESDSNFESENDKYFVFSRRLDKQLWGDEQSILSFSEFAGIEIATQKVQLAVPPHQRCTRQIDRSLGKSIQSVFEEMLLRTRYERNPGMGADGAFYHFGTVGPGRWITGQTWSPKPHTKPGYLVEIVRSMSSYCEGEKGAGVSELETLVESLLGKLLSENGN
jgi:hypothetical protein